MNFTREIILTRYNNGKIEETTDIVVCEYPLTIYVNGEEMVTLMCSPKSLDYLTLGFLLSEGIIKENSEIDSIEIDEEKGAAYVNLLVDKESSGCFKEKRMAAKGCSGGTVFNSASDSTKYACLDSKLQIPYKNVLYLMNSFAEKSEVFQNTGGVHSAALSDGEKILIFHEDIGRHNALDKVIGETFSKEIDFLDKILFTSGRISSEMLMKAAKQRISIMVSRSAPMDLAIKIGKEINMTIIGFVRGQRMNIYNGKERINFDS